MEFKESQNVNSDILDIILNKFDQLIAAVLEQKLTPKIPPEKVLCREKVNLFIYFYDPGFNKAVCNTAIEFKRLLNLKN